MTEDDRWIDEEAGIVGTAVREDIRHPRYGLFTRRPSRNKIEYSGDPAHGSNSRMSAGGSNRRRSNVALRWSHPVCLDPDAVSAEHTDVHDRRDEH